MLKRFNLAKKSNKFFNKLRLIYFFLLKQYIFVDYVKKIKLKQKTY